MRSTLLLIVPCLIATKAVATEPLWDVDAPPAVAELVSDAGDPDGPEIVTVLPGVGWASWRPDNTVHWIVPSSDGESSSVPIWGVSAWDPDGDGYHDILVVSEDGSGTRTLRVISAGGTEYVPAGGVPTATKLSVLSGVPRVGDVDGDGDPDFVVGLVSGAVEVYDDLALTSTIATATPQSQEVRIEVADLLASTGVEIAASYGEPNPAVYCVDLVGSSLDATVLPEDAQTPLGESLWPPSVMEAVGASSARIGVLSDAGVLYRWESSGTAFALETGYPEDLGETTRGEMAIGVAAGEVRSIARTVSGIKVRGANGVARTDLRIPDRHATAYLPTFVAEDHLAVGLEGAGLCRVEWTAGVASYKLSAPAGGARPGVTHPSDAPSSGKAVAVLVNGMLLHEQFLSGDFLPGSVTLEAAMSQVVPGVPMEIILLPTSGAEVMDVRPTTQASGEGWDTARYEVGVGEYTVRILVGDEVGDEFNFRVEEVLRLEQMLAFPNPARDHVELTFISTVPATARFTVYTLAGRKAYSSDEHWVTTGYNAIPWDLRTRFGKRVANGTYLYVLEAEAMGHSVSHRGRLSVAR